MILSTSEFIIFIFAFLVSWFVLMSLAKFLPKKLINIFNEKHYNYFFKKKYRKL